MKNVSIEMNKILNQCGKLKFSDVSPEQIEQVKDYIRQLDLSQLVLNEGKVSKFKEIIDPLEMVRFLLSRRKINALSEPYVSHYTNYDSAKKIISGRKLYLSNPACMNDGLEFSSSKMDSSKIYFASFSIESGENIGMWSMYGQPWEDGVKISIPKKIFSSWADKIKKVYYIDSETNEIITSTPLIEDDFNASISRVAYVEWDDNEKISAIHCGDTENSILKDIDLPIFTGLIKDAAWSYEKEVRLRVDLNFKISDKKVAIDIPNEIMKSIVITTGPRFKNFIPDEEVADIKGKKQSTFKGKLNYIYCDKCRA